MKKVYSKSSRQGLPGGPNEMFQKVKGIIVSERGQWDFPGMNTLVPTQDGRITMRGVPYPVLGQDETGYTQMMYPEQEYQFPGQNVLELPMAQNGLSTPIINLPEYTVIDEKIPENIRLANTAKRLVEELYDVSRPAAGFTEKISDLFIPGEKKYYDNTCVKGVCDIFKEANLNSGIPEDVLNNKDFLENYSKYGFTLVPNEQLQVGDIIQYYEKDRPTHLGIYVGDDEYVGDGSKDKPLVKSNIHKYPDGKDKLPFRAFRKNFKSGGSLPKAQNGPPTYSDSLELYKNTVALENFLRSKNATVPKDKFRRWQWEDSQPLVGTNPARNWYTLNPNLSDREKALSYANSLYNVDKSTGSKSLPKSHYIKTQNNLIGTRDWAPEGEDDKDFPVSYIHPQIKPQFEGDVDDMSGVAGSFYMYRYDPIAIKPGALLTPKELAIRLKKYGKRGIPQSKVDEYYASKKPVTTSAAPPVALPVTPKKEFVRNIHQYPFKNPATGKTEDRVSLITPAHQYIMNLSQYSKLLPTDSIPQKGNFLYRTNYKQNGGALPKAQMLGEFNPQLFQPNPITGLYNWEKPRVKPKLSDFEPKQKAAPRSSTSVATKSDPVKAARQINAAAAEEYERNRQGVIRATNRPVSVFRPGAGDPEAIMEFTGLPSAVRIAQNPESVNDFLSGVDQLILGSSPVSGMMGMRRDFTPEETQALLDYSTVATMGLPLVRGAGKLGAQGLKQTGNIAKIGLREGVDLFHPVGRNLKRIEQEGISKGLSAQAIKNRQMQEVGITSLQRKGYFPGVSEILSEYFVPYAYDNPTKRLLDIPKKIIKGDRNTKRLADLTKVILDEGKNTLSKPRYDAWRMYSGLPQKHGTFRIAETHPINHPSYTKNQLNNLEKFSLNDERKLLHQLPNEYDTFRFMYNDEDLIEAVPHLKEALKNINKLEKTGIDFPQSDFTTTNIMGGYNRRFFDNKMEYNDIWDLDLNGLKVDKYFGKPFMSHGQLEYSFEPARNAINTLLRRADILEKNINPFTKYNFDDINIKGYNNITYKDFVKPKKQLGGALPKAQVGAGAYGVNQMQNAQPTMQRFGGNVKFQDGGDYNMQRALELGYTPDEAGHYPSVDEETGMWLKSKQHPTAWMESMYGYQLNPEVYKNYNVVYNPEGYFGDNQLQYVDKSQEYQIGGSLPKFQVAGSTSLPTLYVDPNDPADRRRYQAYQDSLSLYKQNFNQLKSEKQTSDIKFLKRIPFNSIKDSDYAEGFFEKNDNYDSRSKGEVYKEKIKPVYFDINEIDGKTQHSAYYKKPVQPVKYKPNPEIVAKQQQLIDAGFDIGRPDGIWGKKSQAAWEELQNKSTPSSKTSAPSRNFRETISQIPYKNPITGETETRVVLRTPKDEFMMNLEQYGKLGLDSIPKEGNYIFKRRTYAYGGPLQTDPVLNFITQQQPRRFSKSKK